MNKVDSRNMKFTQCKHRETGSHDRRYLCGLDEAFAADETGIAGRAPNSSQRQLKQPEHSRLPPKDAQPILKGNARCLSANGDRQSLPESIIKDLSTRSVIETKAAVKHNISIILADLLYLSQISRHASPPPLAQSQKPAESASFA